MMVRKVFSGIGLVPLFVVAWVSVGVGLSTLPKEGAFVMLAYAMAIGAAVGVMIWAARDSTPPAAPYRAGSTGCGRRPARR